MTYPLRRIPHLPVAADDGTVLSCSVIMPDAPGDGPFPAVLDAVPYRKDDDFLWTNWDTYAYLAERGFACVQLDLRGSGSSAGVLLGEYLPLEQDDACAVLRAIAAEDWCTGAIGMTGVSWGGFAAIQTAMRRPPELRAIVPIHATHDRYHFDVHAMGGCLLAQENVDWYASMLAESALPPHAPLVGERFEELWRERLEGATLWTLDWLRHQRRDAFWQHGSLIEDYGAIECAVLAIGGWADGYRDAVLAMLEHLEAPCRGIIGPWGHSRPHRGWPLPAIDHREEMRRWFDRWLNGRDNGADREPALTIFEPDGVPRDPYPARVPGRWRAWASWPPAAPPRLTLHLDGETLAERPAVLAQGRVWDGPQWAGHSMPHWCGMGEPGGFGVDMRPDDAVSLCFTTPPLIADLQLLGVPRLRLAVSADRPRAFLCARLEHVHPDGFSALATRGVLNLAHRAGHDVVEPLVPGTVYEVELPLMSLALRLRAGDRLRLTLSGVDWPLVWPAPERVALTVHLGDGRAGSLELPLTPALGAVQPTPFVEPVEQAGNPVRHEEVTPAAWLVERDHVARVTRSRLRTGVTRSLLPDGGVHEIGGELVVEIGDDDPLSCRAEGRNFEAVTRDGLAARSDVRLELRADRDAFSVDAELQVERDGAPWFARRWRERVERDGM